MRCGRLKWREISVPMQPSKLAMDTSANHSDRIPTKVWNLLLEVKGLMDLYNNRIGRDLEREFRDDPRPAEDIVMEALRTGRLQTRPFSTFASNNQPIDEGGNQKNA